MAACRRRGASLWRLRLVAMWTVFRAVETGVFKRRVHHLRAGSALVASEREPGGSRTRISSSRDRPGMNPCAGCQRWAERFWFVWVSGHRFLSGVGCGLRRVAGAEGVAACSGFRAKKGDKGTRKDKISPLPPYESRRIQSIGGLASPSVPLSPFSFSESRRTPSHALIELCSFLVSRQPRRWIRSSKPALLNG